LWKGRHWEFGECQGLRGGGDRVEKVERVERVEGVEKVERVEGVERVEKVEGGLTPQERRNNGNVPEIGAPAKLRSHFVG